MSFTNLTYRLSVFVAIHMVQLEVAMKELIWHGTVAQVLKSINQELWV